jgi:hypothetical protein
VRRWGVVVDLPDGRPVALIYVYAATVNEAAEIVRQLLSEAKYTAWPR